MYWNLLILLLFSLLLANSSAVGYKGEEISDVSDVITELISVNDYQLDIESAEDYDFENTTYIIIDNDFTPLISKRKIWCKKSSIVSKERLRSSDLSPPDLTL